MSLEGTLATFSIPDVLQLLAATKKSGMLAVTGDNSNGELWLDGGAVVAASATGETPSSDPVAVLMGLLRLEDGSFAFNDGAAADDPGDPQEVGALLEAATALAAEWAELEAVVPSSDAWVTLVADLGADEVTLTKEDWSRLVAVAGGVTAAELATTFDVDAISTARWVKDLVDRSLVEVAPEAPEGARGEGASATPLASPQPEEATAEPTPEWEPVVIEDDATTVDVDVDEVEEESAPEPAEPEPSETSWAPLGGLEVEATPDVVEEPEPASAIAAMESGTDFDPSALLREMGMGSGGGSDDEDDKSSANDGFLPAADGGLGGLSGGEMDINPSDAAEMARQLADLSPEAAKAVAAAAKATSDADLQRALDEVVALDSSINRDLLMKFLGSVNS